MRGRSGRPPGGIHVLWGTGEEDVLAVMLEGAQTQTSLARAVSSLANHAQALGNPQNKQVIRREGGILGPSYKTALRALPLTVTCISVLSPFNGEVRQSLLFPAKEPKTTATARSSGGRG